MGLKDLFKASKPPARTAPLLQAPRLDKPATETPLLPGAAPSEPAETAEPQAVAPAEVQPSAEPPLPLEVVSVAASAPSPGFLFFPDENEMLAERQRKAEAERAERALQLEALSLSLLDRWNELEEELPSAAAVRSRSLADQDEPDRNAKAARPAVAGVSAEDVTAVVNTIPDAILTFDDQGRIVSANAGAEAMFGYAAADLLHLPLARLLEGAAEGSGVELTAFAADTAQSRSVREWRGLRQDGTALVVEVSMGAVTVAGVRHGAAVVRDITARKAAEDERSRLTESLQQQVAETQAALEALRSTQDRLVQSEKMASLGVLVAGIAHEINTPVGIAVTAASHLMERMALLTEAITNGTLKKSQLLDTVATSRESAAIVLSNLVRAAELIQSFKQVAVDQTSREMRTIDLDVYLHETLNSLRPRIKASAQRVELLCPPGVSLHIAAGALSQLVSNLVLNALEHAYPGGQPGLVRVVASVDGEQVELVVEDDGAGIAAEVLPHIYDPFFTTRRGSGGSGLGLHIVYNLVTQTLGGSIAVRSRPGEGTRFTVRWLASRAGAG